MILFVKRFLLTRSYPRETSPAKERNAFAVLLSANRTGLMRRDAVLPTVLLINRAADEAARAVSLPGSFLKRTKPAAAGKRVYVLSFP